MEVSKEGRLPYFNLIKCPRARVSVRFLEWGGSGVVINKTSILAIFSLSTKTYKKKSYLERVWEIISYQRLAGFQYQVMHSIMFLKFSTKIIVFLSPFCNISGREGVVLFNFFFTPEWNLFKCMYEVPRQICVWAIVLRYPLRPVGFLSIKKYASDIFYRMLFARLK